MQPVDRFRITNPFAARGRYASRRDEHGPAGHHTGIDYGKESDTVPINGRQVQTIVPGIVAISEHNGTMGNWVGVYDPSTDLLVTYWHLSSRAVTIGQRVPLGAVVGRVGSTGNSTGPHLHMQVNRGRAFNYHGHIDPAIAIRAYEEPAVTKPMRVDGTDVSRHQPRTLDWAAFKRAGGQWAYLKATEGQTLTDEDYAFFRRATAAAGVVPGAYSFARPEDIKGPDADAVRECRHFLEVAKPRPGELRPALDLEVRDDPDVNDTPELREWARQWIAECVRLIGVKPVVYTPYDLGDVLDGCIVWRPRYNNQNTPPELPWDIFQFSNGVLGVPNSVAGLGHVDLNHMRPGLTLADLTIPAQEDDMPTAEEIAKAVWDAPAYPGDKDPKRAKLTMRQVCRRTGSAQMIKDQFDKHDDDQEADPPA